MYPPALTFVSKALKHGSDLPLTIRGTRRPSRTCWPRLQEMRLALTCPPLAPEVVINCIWFFGNFFTRPEGRQVFVTAVDNLPHLLLNSKSRPCCFVSSRMTSSNRVNNSGSV